MPKMTEADRMLMHKVKSAGPDTPFTAAEVHRAMELAGEAGLAIGAAMAAATAAPSDRCEACYAEGYADGVKLNSPEGKRHVH